MGLYLYYTSPETYIEKVECFTSKSNAHGTVWYLLIKKVKKSHKLVDQFDLIFVFYMFLWYRIHSTNIMKL